MIRNTLQKAPVYLLLAPLFFVWHIYNAYFGYVYLKYPLIYFGIFLSAAIGLFALGWILIRQVRAAGLWAAIILLPYLFWAPFHDFMKSLPLPPRLSSYTVLLPVYFIAIVSSFLFLRIKKPDLSRFTFFLNLLFIVFVGLEIISTGYKIGSGELSRLDIGKNKSTTTLISQIKKTAVAPDIFFVVFDEYASSKALSTYLHFDNSTLDSTLEHNHFLIAEDARSNYNSTPHSLASTLNLDYLQADLEGAPSDPRHMIQAQYAYKKSVLPKTLNQLGYQVKNLGLMDIDDYPSSSPSFFNKDMDFIFTRETMGGRIYWEIWWNFTSRWSWLKTSPAKKEKWRQVAIQRNKTNLNHLLSELKTQTGMPKFVMAHIMLPHRPFYLDRSGQLRNTDNDYHLSNDSLYLDQLYYTNTWIKKIAETANQSFQRPRVIIVAGDHGKRDNELPIAARIRDKQFMNLSAYYFSDGRDSLLYPSITPVNTFRVVLNNYFNAGLPLLKDSCIMIK
ncbi:MAG: sulfatase-like hydrolase/transferase [Sphingobacteriales bacterium]|nr:sulfatase-like hydrolase/transferase [Sphingobacteriales bacterium]OJW33749.1 MAG: hypothetical protein BGO54_11010 [Sphingobacteriales bacterium 46-32]